MTRLPKQTRYRAAPLPDRSFSRRMGLVGQTARGTDRKRAAHSGTQVPTFCGTSPAPTSRLNASRDAGRAGS